MNKREKLFFIAWGMIIFPLLLIFLVMVYHLDKSLVSPFLIYMASLKVVYTGSEGFTAWNSIPDEAEGGAQPDDGGH